MTPPGGEDILQSAAALVESLFETPLSRFDDGTHFRCVEVEVQSQNKTPVITRCLLATGPSCVDDTGMNPKLEQALCHLLNMAQTATHLTTPTQNGTQRFRVEVPQHPCAHDKMRWKQHLLTHQNQNRLRNLLSSPETVCA